MVAAAAASAALFGGTAQADEPVNRGGEPGKPGTASNVCRSSMPPQGDPTSFCVAKAEPGVPGPAVAYS
jgi:hypothetical protein